MNYNDAMRRIQTILEGGGGCLEIKNDKVRPTHPSEF